MTSRYTLATDTFDAFRELYDQAKKEGAQNPQTKAVTDLIAEAIRNKSYKFIKDIRDERGNMVIRKWDVIVLFDFVNEAHFWAIENPTYDGNVMRLIRSNADGSALVQQLYEG